MRRIEELRAASAPGPEATTLAIIGEIVNEQAPSRLDEDTADIKIGAFMDAVEDLPAWAIREALRRWRRGDVGGDRHNLDFGIKPHRLRSLAQMIAAAATGQGIRLQRIVDAEPYDQPTLEEMEKNAAEMVALSAMLAEDAADRIKARSDGAAAAADRTHAREHLAELAARKTRRLTEEAKDREGSEASPIPSAEPSHQERVA